MDKKVVEVLKKMASKIKEQDVLIKRLAQSNCEQTVKEECKQFSTSNDLSTTVTKVDVSEENVTVYLNYKASGENKVHLLNSEKSGLPAVLKMALKEKCGFKNPQVKCVVKSF